jgi:putative (di)nucleoside polyphosphate hydrolase
MVRTDSRDKQNNTTSSIDSDGYRACVGIILSNKQGQVLWAKRAGHSDWQFPQGGIQQDEATETAMYRELMEEVGLQPQQITILGCTSAWLHYDIPRQYRRSIRAQAIKGQKQIWYLLRLLGKDDDVCLDGTDCPEFDEWCWVKYWYPLQHIITFKRQVYEQALTELEPLLTDHVAK